MEEIVKPNNFDLIFLDDEIIRNLREELNSSAVFHQDSKELLNWNFFCALMDRIDSCVNFLNRFEPVSSEENFITFITFGNMIVDGVFHMFKILDMIDPSKNDSTCFSNKGIKGNATDDEFFRYLRSLSFAHPLESSRHPKYIEKKEIQFSPFVIAGKSAYYPKVGVRIYSSKNPKNLNDMTFPFSELSAYIQKKYNLISYATNSIRDRLVFYKTEWAKRKVNRSLMPIDTLKDALEILKSRYNEWQIYDIETAISYLSIDITFKENYAPVQLYRDAIIDSIAQLCDIIDSLDDDKFNECEFLELINCRPRKLHQGGLYQLEKIFTYLNKNDIYNYDFALEQLKSFNKNLAHKYVKISLELETEEIYLLVSTALYLEKTTQEK